MNKRSRFGFGMFKSFSKVFSSNKGRRTHKTYHVSKPFNSTGNFNNEHKAVSLETAQRNAKLVKEIERLQREQDAIDAAEEEIKRLNRIAKSRVHRH